MTTYSWECLVEDCDATGTADSYDNAIADAAAHNEEAEHIQPAISYGNDEPESEPAPTPPSAVQLFAQAADAIQNASNIEDIKTAFAELKTSIEPFLPTE